MMKRRGVSFRHAVELLREGVLPLAADGGAKRSTVKALPAPVQLDADDQALLNQTVSYYHERLLATSEAAAYLAARGLAHPELVAHFKLGVADRTLGLRLPDKTRRAGADIRARLQKIGLIRDSGHEHFNASAHSHQRLAPRLQRGEASQQHRTDPTGALRRAASPARRRCCSTTADHHQDQLTFNPDFGRMAGTAPGGRSHLEVKIVDASGSIVPVGEKGELCTKGYSVMQGYWNDPERTAESVRDGWMHTGDLATLDAEGYCNIVGRVKDMVIRGGENVYPREVEEFLFTHPKVAAVQVFGVPDVRYGEELAAWIITKPGQSCTEDEVREFCRDQIAHYKVPRYIRFVQELPVTVTGKPQKFVMREAMVHELGLASMPTA